MIGIGLIERLLSGTSEESDGYNGGETADVEVGDMTVTVEQVTITAEETNNDND